MKVNLECGTDIRNSCLNISSWPSVQQVKDLPEDTQFVVGRYNNLNPILENGSVEEINFAPALNVLTPDTLVACLDHWKNKLSVGGKLTLSFIDINRVARAITMGEVDIQQADQLLFGPQHAFKSLIELNVLKSVLAHLNLKVEYIDLKQFFATIEVVKQNDPEN